MSENICNCEECGEDFCGRCFMLTPCSVCSIEVCEKCFDNLKEKECCGDRECPNGCDCGCEEEETDEEDSEDE